MDARLWYVRDGVRVPVGPPLDRGRLSDDHGGRLRFTGTSAGVHVRVLVDASFTADFRVRLTCTPA
ncbi:hypothetical protein ACFW2D_04180 [Streptomyces sp. NPDC058914]|uniref:hypothetical protein n=1 Tax=Streptomyces sp. NPDC058914 TaxID=3346671 RepID=UPI0036AF4C71